MTAKTETLERINIAAASDIGNVRTENEDFYYYSKSKRFIVVCDGMGGHQKGSVASKIAGETIRDIMLANDTLREVVIYNKLFNVSKACHDLDTNFSMLIKKLIAGIRLANRNIITHSLNKTELQGMGTTLVTAAFNQGEIMIAHVGDSRVYRLRDGKLKQMTKDHSWLNELIEDEEITEEQIHNFRKKNVLTRAMGTVAKIKVDILIETAQPNDLYLVCTDGLSNALSDDLIQSVLSAYHGSLQNKISNLVKSAKLMNGSDNITGGLLYISGHWSPNVQYRQNQYLIGEEPDEVSRYLDKTIKELYSEMTIKDKLNLRVMVIGAAIVILLLVSVLLLQQ